jgi:hypothetical protein
MTVSGTPAADAEARRQPGTPRQAAGGSRSRAADHAAAKNSTRVTLPVLGQVTLPPKDQLVFLAGLAGLAIAEIVEWPVAVAVGAGHILAHNRSSKTVRDFGEALEEA